MLRQRGHGWWRGRGRWAGWEGKFKGEGVLVLRLSLALGARSHPNQPLYRRNMLSADDRENRCHSPRTLRAGAAHPQFAPPHRARAPLTTTTTRGTPPASLRGLKWQACVCVCGGRVLGGRRARGCARKRGRAQRRSGSVVFGHSELCLFACRVAPLSRPQRPVACIIVPQYYTRFTYTMSDRPVLRSILTIKHARTKVEGWSITASCEDRQAAAEQVRERLH